MLITPGKVHDGTIQLDGERLPEGAIVTVLTHEGDENVRASKTAHNRNSRTPFAGIGKPDAGSQIWVPQIVLS